MRHHTVDLDEMLDWINRRLTSRVTFASSTREHKALDVVLAGGYEVVHNGDVVWSGTDGRTAVERYNAITSR